MEIVNLDPSTISFVNFTFVGVKINIFCLSFHMKKKKKSNCLIKLVDFYDYWTIIQHIHIYLLHLISKKYLKS